MHRLLMDLVGYSCRKAEPNVIRKQSIVNLEGDSIIFTPFNRVQIETIRKLTKEDIFNKFEKTFGISNLGTPYAKDIRGHTLFVVPRADSSPTYIAISTTPPLVELSFKSSPRVLSDEIRNKCRMFLMDVLCEKDKSEW